MKVSDHPVLQRLFVCASLAVLAACNGVSQFGPLGGARQESLAPSVRTKDFKTIYKFGPLPDGNGPKAGLIAMNGIFYGTTFTGGNCNYYYVPCGTVFSVTPAGQEHLIYSFQGGYTDGDHPAAPLLAMNGLLYGTTTVGGGHDSGTVFAVTTGGAEKVLHSFGPDGSEPYSGLVNVHGTLYGTTNLGGSYCYWSGGCGTVFSITTKGVEKVLHSFSGFPDGDGPYAGLIDVGDTLYGTTEGGGAYGRSGGPYGNGTVFSVTTSGSEKVLYAFKGGADGSQPRAGLVALNGVLYGTTQSGGTGCHSAGCGTVYSITTSGKEKVLYRFLGGSDGQDPTKDLTVMKGRLYGTTQRGGTFDYGTIFSVTTSGQEKILHRFTGTTDGGGYPNNLISVNGVLYGTTSWVCYQCESNIGEVFRLSP